MERPRDQAYDIKDLARRPSDGWLTRGRSILSLMRIGHWQKNLLLFVPMVIGHDFSPDTIKAAVAAFIAFSLAASSAYALNDLLDLDADRQHQFKKNRPLANGSLSPATAVWTMIVLLVAALSIASFLPLEFLAMLAIYYCATTLYTLVIKKMLGLDVVVLALLYALRVIAGDAAIGSDSSEWLIAFSLFFSLALALIKRFTELSYLMESGARRVPSRAYKVEDLQVMVPLAAAAGFSAITIFVRFIGSDEVTFNFSRPERLWYIAPVLIYWMIRLMLLANRLRIQDDPVLFATSDSKSLLCGLLIFLLLLWAW